MKYLILLDDKGQRITSLVEGIHGKNMDELKEKAKDFSPAQLLEADDEVQNKFLQGLIYVKGQFVEPAPYVPSKTEIRDAKRQAIINEYEPILEQLRTDYAVKSMAGLDVSDIQKRFKEVIEEKKAKIDAIDKEGGETN